MDPSRRAPSHAASDEVLGAAASASICRARMVRGRRAEAEFIDLRKRSDPPSARDGRKIDGSCRRRVSEGRKASGRGVRRLHVRALSVFAAVMVHGLGGWVKQGRAEPGTFRGGHTNEKKGRKAGGGNRGEEGGGGKEGKGGQKGERKRENGGGGERGGN